jgi:hypothetical protein
MQPTNESKKQFNKKLIDASFESMSTCEFSSIWIDGVSFRVLFADGRAYADDSALSETIVLPFSARKEGHQTILDKIKENWDKTGKEE